MVPGSARNWIAVNAVQQSNLNKNETKNMTTLRLRKSIGRSPLRLALLLIPLGLACFALSPAAQALVPAPDGDYPNGNTAEGDGALLSLTTDAPSTYEPYSFTTFADSRPAARMGPVAPHALIVPPGWRG